MSEIETIQISTIWVEVKVIGLVERHHPDPRIEPTVLLQTIGVAIEEMSAETIAETIAETGAAMTAATYEEKEKR